MTAGHEVEGSVAAQLDALAAAWTVLSRLLLAPPSEETLRQVRDPAMLAEWPLAAVDPASTPALRLLAQSAEIGEDSAAIRRDHNRLFVGPGGLLAPPYESVHLSVDRLLFDTETLQVRAWYARYGLTAPRLNRDPDDHIGLELEFLATLALHALGALEGGRTAEAGALLGAHQEFLTTHLLTWGPDLMELVRDRADTVFYRGVGALGLSTMAAAESLLVS